MQSYIADFIPRLARYSKKLDNLAALVDKEWILFDPETNERRTFIFRRNNELLISHHGKVVKSKWELIGDRSILLEIDGQSLLLRNGFIDEAILALKLDDTDKYFMFIDELNFSNKINSIEQIKNNLVEKYDKENIEVRDKSELQNTELNPGAEVNQKLIDYYALAIMIAVTLIIIFVSNL